MADTKKLINCGFNSHFDPESGHRFMKTASGDFTEVDDGAKGILERTFVEDGMKKFLEEDQL